MLTRVFAFAVALSSLVVEAHSQSLQISPSSPSEGAAGVPLSTRIEFRTSKPLPAFGSAFSDKFIWSPQQSVAVSTYGHDLDDSNNITVIFFDVTQTADTDVTFIAYGVKAADGSTMERPFVLNYSTAPTNGSGVVNGSVTAGERTLGDAQAGTTAPVTDLARSVVLLLDEYDLSASSWRIRKAGVLDAAGAFSIGNVRDGTYWPVAINYASSTGEVIGSYGFYDPDGDLSPDPITVQGNSLSGIDLKLFPYTPAAAQTHLSLATAYAAQFASDQQLLAISASADPSGVATLPDGTAYQWNYSFCSSAQGAITSISIDPININATYEPIPAGEPSGCDRQRMPETFVDSGTALQTADLNGGSAFRARYPGGATAVYMAAGDLLLPVRPPLGEVFWAVQYVSPPDAAFETLTVFVDAVTGDALVGSPVSSDSEHDLPQTLSLEPNYPNPFTQSTNIPLSLALPGPVRVSVYDVLGREVAILLDEYRPAGTHMIRWDAGSLPSGVYVCRAESGGRMVTRPITLVR